MNLILNLFTKREIMIIGIVVGSLILIVLVMTLIDYLSRRKKEDKELSMAFDELDFEPIKLNKNDVKEEIVIKKEDIKNEININEVEKNTEVKENIDQEILKSEELKPEFQNVITNELKKEKINVNYIEPIIIDIDDVEKKEEIVSKSIVETELSNIEKQLQNAKSLEDTLYDLELEEEENAIISYQELLETTRELKIVTDDSGDEIISLKEMMNKCENPKLEEINDNVIDIGKEMTKVSIDEAYNKEFTSTPFLSPIVGFENENHEVQDLAEIQLENTANLEKLDKELRKTNQFLKVLNDLKKNLD